MAYKDKEKQREYVRIWTANRRKQWFIDKSCVDCGSTETLELDHINPTTKVSHKIWSWSEKRRNEELVKCVPRCTKCHRIRTNAQLARKPNELGEFQCTLCLKFKLPSEFHKKNQYLNKIHSRCKTCR